MNAFRPMTELCGRAACGALLFLAGCAWPGLASATEQRNRLAQAQDPAWTSRIDTTPRGVSIEARAASGSVGLTGACATALLRSGLWMTLSDVSGLPRIDGRRMTFSFAVTGRFGTQVFKTRMRYEAPGDTWPTEGPLPPDFLTAFETGGLLAISDASGRKLGEFSLKGAEEAVRLMRRVCHL
ncbi:MAG TPA: hypothetical protein VIU82_21635 [Bosea sp. (in: a-proteobacteria)]